MTQNLSENINFIPKSLQEFEDFYDYRAYKFDNLPLIQQTISPEIQQAFQEFHLANTLTEKSHHNPTNLTNPYWQWVVRYDLSADNIGEIFELDTCEIAPLWCCERLGQSHTVLPDGREILVGGEWEDHYDPQFAIYSDVIVKHSNGDIEIFGYPRHVFAPTDFHTATLVGDTIWIIGSLGYGEDRQTTQTSVYKLNIATYKIEKVETRNSMGWVHGHTATLKDSQILMKSGLIWLNEEIPIIENYDDWTLNLKTLIWKNITKKQWQCFYVERKDHKRLHLWEMNSLEWSKKYDTNSYQEWLIRLEKELGATADFETYAKLFSPPIEHEIEKNPQEFNTSTIFIDSIKIRYVDKSHSIQVYIEGILPTHKLELLQENLRHKLSKLENFACEVKELVF